MRASGVYAFTAPVSAIVPAELAGPSAPEVGMVLTTTTGGILTEPVIGGWIGSLQNSTLLGGTAVAVLNIAAEVPLAAGDCVRLGYRTTSIAFVTPGGYISGHRVQ